MASTEAYLYQQIMQQESLLSDLSRCGNSLEERLSDLYRLRSRFDEVRDDFFRSNARRESVIARFSPLGLLSRSAKLYQEGMQSVLAGSHNQRAARGLAEGSERIERAIRDCERDMETNRTRIVATRNTIEQLYRQLQRVQMDSARTK